MPASKVVPGAYLSITYLQTGLLHTQVSGMDMGCPAIDLGIPASDRLGFGVFSQQRLQIWNNLLRKVINL
jgi:hypothetical protein